MPRIRLLHDDLALTTANRRVAAQAIELVGKLLDRADQLREQGDDRGAGLAAKAAQHASLVNGISLDKSLLLSGRPTQITEHRDVDQILDSLRSMGLVLDGSATEIPPELPPGDA